MITQAISVRFDGEPFYLGSCFPISYSNATDAVVDNKETNSREDSNIFAGWENDETNKEVHGLDQELEEQFGKTNFV